MKFWKPSGLIIVLCMLLASALIFQSHAGRDQLHDAHVARMLAQSDWFEEAK